MPRHSKADSVEQRLGNPRKQRKAESPVPTPAKIATLRPPVELRGKLARKEWRRVAPYLAAMGVLSEVDRGVLAAYCRGWEWFVEAANATEGHKGFQIMIRAAKEFGMSASARAGMELAKPVGRKRATLADILEGKAETVQ